MPVLGIATISSSQFNLKRGHNSTETKRQNMQFLLKHLIPAILLACLIFWVFFFPNSPLLNFALELEGWLSPAVHSCCTHARTPAS